MRFFKQAMNASFMDYLIDHRLTMAAHMLLTTNESILIIATDCGFDNISYFNRRFKRKYDTTPRAYRNLE